MKLSQKRRKKLLARIADYELSMRTASDKIRKMLHRPGSNKK